MNGCELCKQVKLINQEIIFVLFMAYQNTSLLLEAKAVGVDDFLYKPIQANKLFRLIEKIYNDIDNKLI